MGIIKASTKRFLKMETISMVSVGTMIDMYIKLRSLITVNSNTVNTKMVKKMALSIRNIKIMQQSMVSGKKTR